MRFLYSAVALICLSQLILAKRDGKLLSLFNVVTFPNDACNAGTKNGTCYTKSECSTKGGTEDGSCASGYGVCCVFTAKCGDSIAENNTYFESGGSESGSCAVKICPVNTNICQLRLDFDTFVISGPSTDTTSVGKWYAGQPATGGQPGTAASRCLTDIFTVTSSGAAPSPICGRNSGSHMYVDSTTACNDLSFLLGSTGFGTTLASRSWSIRATQLECGSSTLAPSGCTQYYYGSSTGTIQSYNWDGGDYHLANQKQVICFRREKGNCRICYTTSSTNEGYKNDFQISGASSVSKFVSKSCCSYGTGKKTAFDCIRIPGAEKFTAPGSSLAFDGFCGQAGLATKSTKVTTNNAKTICSTKQPFRLTFTSDNWEDSTKESAASITNKGFQLYFSQDSTNC